MSIPTGCGDTGETSLRGGIRISKAALRGEVYGPLDELISAMGLARALCPNSEVRAGLSHLWLFGRLVEVELPIDSKLREAGNQGPRWSRAG